MEASPSLFKALNGVFCLYKPQGKTVKQVVSTLQMNLARELNKLPCRPMKLRTEIREEGLIPTISTVPDLADHVLVVGPRYKEQDFQIEIADSLKYTSSGVTLCGIGKGCSLILPIMRAKYLKVYHVHGELGTVYSDFTPSGKIMEKTTYHHVTQARIDRVVAGLQANHQKHMYMASGYDLQSEEAYKLACEGPVRPSNPNSGPVVYGMRCISFQPPHFIIELHMINGTCDYLAKLIHNIGLEARSSAFCTQIRRIRYGRFGLDESLLMKHASNPVHLAENIAKCRKFLDFEKVRHFPTLQSFDKESELLEAGDMPLAIDSDLDSCVPLIE